MSKRSSIAGEWPFHKVLRDRARVQIPEMRKEVLAQLLKDMLSAMDGVEAMFREEMAAMKIADRKKDAPS